MAFSSSAPASKPVALIWTAHTACTRMLYGPPGPNPLDSLVAVLHDDMDRK